MLYITPVSGLSSVNVFADTLSAALLVIKKMPAGMYVVAGLEGGTVQLEKTVKGSMFQCDYVSLSEEA